MTKTLKTFQFHVRQAEDEGVLVTIDATFEEGAIGGAGQPQPPLAYRFSATMPSGIG